MAQWKVLISQSCKPTHSHGGEKPEGHNLYARGFNLQLRPEEEN